MATSDWRDTSSGSRMRNSRRHPHSDMDTDEGTVSTSYSIRYRSDTHGPVSSILQSDDNDLIFDNTRQMFELLHKITELKPEVKQEIDKLEKHVCRASPRETDELLARLQQTEAEIVKLKKENNDMKETLKTQEPKNEVYRKLNEDKEELEMKLRSTEEENRRLETDLQEKNTYVVDLQKYVKETVGELTNKYKTATSEALQEKLAKEENQRLFKMKADKVEQMKQVMSQQSDVIKTKTEEIRESKKQLMDTKKDLDETKSRLSQMMGNQMKDGNPYITDLSDKNRPTKLSEMYTELYDNEWTDAFDVIQNASRNQDEKDTVKQLYDILLDINKFCQTEAENQTQQLKHGLLVGCKVWFFSFL